MNKELLKKYTQEIESCECDKEKSILYMERAKVYQSMGQTPPAINDFNESLRLDPENKETKSYLEYIYEILDYRYILYYDV